MGMAMFYSGDVTGAKAKFEDALQKNPYHIQLLNDLATTYEQTKEPERAIALYKQALDITPYFPQSLLNISAAYFNIGRKDSAFVFIDKLYGIKLDDQGKKSYNAYLPAILREKVYLGLDLVPEALREKAVQEAADSSIVKPAYRRSKTNHTDFIAEFSAAIRDIPMP